MDWSKLLSSRRFGQQQSDGSRVGRTEFESDIDRLFFSGAFRRLGRKTQVHPLAANDHVHTRLTHSLEVGRVGRALGSALAAKISDRLPKSAAADLPTVVQAACLAHDLGNPPFGHAGEKAMADWFEQNGPRLFESLTPEYRHDVISFEGNAQGFRLLTQTENHLFNGGLRLTYATLGAFQKYPCSSRANKPKFGAFISEENILADVAEFLELRRKDDHGWSRHPLAYLVEAADDICYSVIDLEDAVELNILSFEKVKNFLFEVFDGEEKTRIESSLASPLSHRVNLARLRGPLFDKAIEGTIEAFLKGYDRIMEGSLDGSVFDLLDDADPRKKLILGAKDIAKRNVFGDSKKVEIELGCYSIFDTLLNSFCEAALNKADVLNNPAGEHTLKSKSELVLQLLGDHAPSKENAPPKSKWSSYQCLRRVLDYVSGMTDNYAVYIARQLQGVGFAGVQRP